MVLLNENYYEQVEKNTIKNKSRLRTSKILEQKRSRNSKKKNN